MNNIDLRKLDIKLYVMYDKNNSRKLGMTFLLKHLLFLDHIKGLILLEITEHSGSINVQCFQGVSYSQKFRGKRGFSNLANSRTSQFMFPKYLIEYQNIKLVISKFKSKKSNKNISHNVQSQNKH